MKKAELKFVLLSSINVKEQVRTIFDEEPLTELTNSIREKGVLQPIVLNEVNGKLYLVCGERRYRAAKSVQAAFKDRNTIPAAVHADLTDDEVLQMQIIENLQRKDVHPMEEAIAFKKMQDINKFSIEEIAKRVSRTPQFVGGRLKLADLIPDFQKAFYANRMTMVTAMKLCKISAEDQKAFYKEEDCKEGIIQVNNYRFQKYMNNLAAAPFDTKDATLLAAKKVGACTSCPFNSAANTLLFPDEGGKSICMNSSCYRDKCDACYKVKLKEAIEDPAIILVQSGWTSELNKESLALVAKGEKVYTGNQYESIDKPEVVDETDFDRDDYDDEKEWKDALKEAHDDYDREMKDYNKAVASGKYQKAFVVSGDDAGQTYYVTLRKAGASSSSSFSATNTKAAVQEKIKSGNATKQDIEYEIVRMQTNEKSKRELDEEKIAPLVFEKLSKNPKFLSNDTALIPAEKVALIMALNSAIGWPDARNAEKQLEKAGLKHGTGALAEYNFLMANPKKLDTWINILSRFLILNKHNHSQANAAKNDESKAIETIATCYDAPGIKTIRDTQMAERKKREERLAPAIEKMQKLLKGIKANSESKAAAKKK